MKELDYKVERTKDCVKINTVNWLKSNSNIVQRYTISGKTPVNYITEVLDENLSETFEGSIHKGDYVLLTRVMSEICQYKYYEIDDSKFYNVPAMQVIGVFDNNELSINNLTPLFDKIIYKKVEHNTSDSLLSSDSTTTIGKVIKVGTCRFDRKWNKNPMTIKVGDTILVRDNVTTEFMLDGEYYCATEESMVVGVFNDENNLSLDNMTFINKNILMTKYKPKYILNSSILVMPEIDYDSVDEADLDNQNQFEILYLDKRLTKIKEHDIIFINKDLTNYVFFNGTKYNIVSGMDFIEGKQLER